MTQAIAKYAAKKMLAGEMEKYKSKKVDSEYDPYYDLIEHPRKPGKMKKVKKQIPAYIPSHDADILARARKSAYRLDFCLFNFMGFRFGWSSVIGLIPVVGDGADAALAFNLICKMNKIEGKLPRKVWFMMMINLFVDLVVGLIPFVGDLADAAIKCNSKNVRVLEEYLDKKYRPRELKEEDEKLKRRGKKPRPATIYEDFSDEEDERRGTFDDRYDNVHPPQRAYSGRRERIPDEEMGMGRHDTHRSHRNEKPSRNNTKSSRRH